MCGCCIDACPVKAITVKSKKALINSKMCIGCGECICVCKFDAIFIHWEDGDDLFARRMIDAAQFILSKFKNKFFISFALDITKECDCISTKTDPMAAQNLGILASVDPLSLDKATLDLIYSQSPQFKDLRPQGVGVKMFEYARQTGLGNPEYNLITL